MSVLKQPVLIVDDYSTMRRIIRNLLQGIGFSECSEAEDGPTALQKLRANNYGLCISDWNMEPMSGLQLLMEVRADDRLKALPFIMVTAESKPETSSRPRPPASTTTSSSRSTPKPCRRRSNPSLGALK